MGKFNKSRHARLFSTLKGALKLSDLTHHNSISMMDEIRELLLAARQRVAVQVNTELLSTYWNVGKIIVEHEQENKDRADYGKQTLKQLSKGIIFCMDKDSIAAEYALGGLSNNIFASRYISYIPNKGQLITQIEAVLNEWNKVEKGL